MLLCLYELQHVGSVLTLSTLRFFSFCLDLQQTRSYITLTGTNSVSKIKSYAWRCVYLTRVYGQVP